MQKKIGSSGFNLVPMNYYPNLKASTMTLFSPTYPTVIKGTLIERSSALSPVSVHVKRAIHLHQCQSSALFPVVLSLSIISLPKFCGSVCVLTLHSHSVLHTRRLRKAAGAERSGHEGRAVRVGTAQRLLHCRAVHSPRIRVPHSKNRYLSLSLLCVCVLCSYLLRMEQTQTQKIHWHEHTLTHTLHIKTQFSLSVSV